VIHDAMVSQPDTAAAQERSQAMIGQHRVRQVGPLMVVIIGFDLRRMIVKFVAEPVLESPLGMTKYQDGGMLVKLVHGDTIVPTVSETRKMLSHLTDDGADALSQSPAVGGKHQWW
jgi:hypothetical protein